MRQERFWLFLKNRLIELIVFTLFLSGFGWVVYNGLINTFVKTDREKLIEEAYYNPKLAKKEFPKLSEKQINELKEEIDKKYSMFNFSNPKVLIVDLISFWLIPFLISFFVWKYIRSKEGFFFRVGEIELPLKLGKPKQLFWFKDSKTPILDLTKQEFIDIVFNGDKQNYLAMIGFFNGEIIEKGKVKFPRKEINKDIAKITDYLVKWGKFLNLLKDDEEKLFKAIVYLSLMHYIACLYGNIPNGFLSILIKNPKVKYFLSTYYYKKVLKNDEQIKRFLTIFHSLNPYLLEELMVKYTPLAFEKEGSYIYDDKFFTEF